MLPSHRMELEVAYIVDKKLTVTNVAGQSSQAIAVEGGLPIRNVAWSADSKRIAFIADLPGDVPSAQIWTAAADGSTPVKHAELKGYVQAPRFSPDGSKLAILFIEGMPRVAGPLQPMTPLAGVIDEKIFEQRIATIDLSTDHLTQVTPADVYVYEYDWTPDGQGWAATAAHGNGDANWWIARLYLIDASSGEMREIYKPKLQLADPRVSPDGKNVAFIEGLMSDEGSTGGDIHVVPIAGGTARNLTPGIKASPYALAWTGAGPHNFRRRCRRKFWLCQLEHEWRRDQDIVDRARVGSSRQRRLGFIRSKEVTTAIVRQSPSAPPEVWAGPIGNWNQLTHVNADVKPAWGEMKNVHWMNGSMRVQGWLMLPKDYDPEQKVSARS